MLVRMLLAGTAVALALSGAAAAAETQRFTEFSNNEAVGQLVAEIDGPDVRIDYKVSNNGRGPKLQEHMRLSPAGVPTDWTIDGSSLFGAPVHERFGWSQGHAKWQSQADQGERATASPPLYIGNDASPWAEGVYARAALKAKDHTVALLPDGRLKVRLAKSLSVQHAGKPLSLDIYELSGIDLNPSYVMLDKQGDLFAAGAVLREGYEDVRPALAKARAEIDTERAEAAQQALAHRFSGPVRIRNVRIFDSEKMVVTGPSDVVVFRDRIAAVVAPGSLPVEPDETVIDGAGATLVPGLHDMHSHTDLDTNLFNLAAGVTATRDMGNENDKIIAISDGLAAGRFAGPRIVRNGLLEGRSPYSARIGFVADSLPQAIDDVRWYAGHGFYEVKIYNSLNPDWVAPVAAEAHRLGMGVTGHVPAFTTPDRVIEEGYNSIAHVNQLVLGWILKPGEDTRTPLRLTGMTRAANLDLNSEPVRRTVALMQSHHVALDTTIVVLEQLMLSRANEVEPGDKAYLDHMPIGFERYRRRSFVTINSPADDAAYHAGFDKLMQVIAMLDRDGVQLLPGTDENNGFMLQRELELYVGAGISPAKTLRLATLDAARYLHQDAELGSIERGKLADFILVDGDPTKDIGAIRRNRMTMVGGVAYYPQEIYRFLAVKPFAPPPQIAAKAQSAH
jgi:hypothetical protein